MVLDGYGLFPWRLALAGKGSSRGVEEGGRRGRVRLSISLSDEEIEFEGWRGTMTPCSARLDWFRPFDALLFFDKRSIAQVLFACA
jgi:hypothetical protein